MKLEEHFGNVNLGQNHNKDCAEIANNHAVGFAIWLNKKTESAFNGFYYYPKQSIWMKTPQQLLEIYNETIN